MSSLSSTSAFSEIYPDFSACAGIIALFVVGILLVLLFVAWQHYLERRLENPNLPRTRWMAPPLMKPSMWTRAHGRFAVMQIIACVNMAAFAGGSRPERGTSAGIESSLCASGRGGTCFSFSSQIGRAHV